MKERTKLAEAIRLGKFDKADATFLKLMDDNPAELWPVAGYADRMFSDGHYGLAFHLYGHCLKEWKDCPPEYRVVFFSNMAYCLRNAGKEDEALFAFNKALELGIERGAVYNAMAIGYINRGTPEKVIELCDMALKEKPGMPEALWNRGVAYLEQGHWKEGWEGYKYGERMANPRNYHEGKQTQRWDGKRNRTVVVWGEQGVGDEILFGSCLPDMIGAVDRVILDCHPRLEKTWKRSFPGLTIHPTRKTSKLFWPYNEKIDKQISIADLPGFFRNDLAEFPGKPYLKADPARVAYYKTKLAQLGPGPYVGIAWFGGEKKTHTDFRSIPLNKWMPIRNVGGTFISLQYNKWGHRQEAAANHLPEWEGYYDETGPIEDLDEMFALIEACDLVISVCQTLVHMSGAIGKECWCLTPNRPAWRYLLTGDKMPWYNSVHLIRQGKDETWESVIQRTAARYQAAKDAGTPVLESPAIRQAEAMAD